MVAVYDSVQNMGYLPEQYVFIFVQATLCG